MSFRFVNLVAGVVAVALGVLVPSARAAEQSGYVIQPGDTLQIEVLEDSGLNRSVLVLPDGNINFPMAGTVPAQGRSADQVGRAISSALSGNFAAPPNVYVSVASLAKPKSSGRSRRLDVYAVGEVAKPGMVEVRPGTTLLQFLATVGGPTKFAAEKRIELIRTDSRTGAVTTYRFSYRTPAGGTGLISGGTRLAPGDVVKVPQRKLFE